MVFLIMINFVIVIMEMFIIIILEKSAVHSN